MYPVPIQTKHLAQETETSHNSSFMMLMPIPTTASLSTCAASTDLKVDVVQQPIHCRMSGFNFKDVRSIDPPPFIKMTFPTDTTSDLPFHHLICHASLWSKDGSHEITESSRRKHRQFFPHDNSSAESSSPLPSIATSLEFTSSVLVGDRISLCYMLLNAQNIPGFYFVFPDIAVKCIGIFRLKFQLFSLASPGKALASCMSEPFTVYPPKEFPGVLDTTHFTKLFAKQGIRLHIRQSKSKSSTRSPVVSDASETVGMHSNNDTSSAVE